MPLPHLETRSESGRYRQWPAIVVYLRSHPNSWVLRLVDEPARLVRTVKDRSHPALRLSDGRIEARITNGYLDSGGRRRGDVYLRYVPDTPISHDDVG